MAIDELLKEKRDEILRIAARHGARNVRVFGSAARGENDEKSDVDILVEMEPGRSLLDHAALWRELNELMDIKVDVVTEKGLRERIRDRVLKEAVPL
ncbi:MAG: nucleotidyltransferase family protein [bacterium]